jgi:hypothetical protein
LKFIFRAAIVTLFQLSLACQSRTSDNSTNDAVPEFRQTVKKDAIAEYREKVDNSINDWYFSVSLFETPRTFHYLLKMQFEEVRGEDSLKLPDFGIEPKPEIHKGRDRYSCIIGFLDGENKFREYKEVSVKNGTELKLTTLNHYTVVRAPSGK